MWLDVYMTNNHPLLVPGELYFEIAAWSLFTWLARFAGSPYYAIV